jgi:hypothetical protein
MRRLLDTLGASAYREQWNAASGGIGPSDSRQAASLTYFVFLLSGLPSLPLEVF